MRKLYFNSRTYALCALVSICILFGNSLLGQEQKRDVSGYTSISYSLPGHLEIIQGTTESLVLKGDMDMLDKIITEIDGSELKIYTKGCSNHMSDIVVLVSVINLNSLSAAGSGDVVFKSETKTSEMEINLSGSGNVKCMDLLASSTELNLAGSGSIQIGGVVNESIEINISGSGNVDAEKLQAKESEVNISGSGSVKVWATDKLDSNIVGSGCVYYKGKPLVDTSTTGSGSTKSF